MLKEPHPLLVRYKLLVHQSSPRSLPAPKSPAAAMLFTKDYLFFAITDGEESDEEDDEEEDEDMDSEEDDEELGKISAEDLRALAAYGRKHGLPNLGNIEEVETSDEVQPHTQGFLLGQRPFPLIMSQVRVWARLKCQQYCLCLCRLPAMRSRRHCLRWRVSVKTTGIFSC